MTPTHSFPNTRKIELFIAGAQKAGTTSLKNYLGEHPALQTHVQKEFAYFYDDNEYRAGAAEAYRKYFGKETDQRKLVAKNAGLYVKEEAIRRLHLHNPACKIVLLLRNPVDRAYSAFQMEKNYGNCSGDFDELKEVFRKADNEDWRYEMFIRMGMYVDYLRIILRYFPAEQVIIYRFEELCEEPDRVCRELFAALGVDTSCKVNTSVRYNVTHTMRSHGYARFMVKLLQNNNPIKKLAGSIIPSKHNFKIGEMLRNVNKTQRKPQMISTDMARLLTTMYTRSNEELSAMTGKDFSDWNRDSVSGGAMNG